MRAYSGFRTGKVVCDWDAADKEPVVRTYVALGLPHDEVVAVEAICEQGAAGVDTCYLEYRDGSRLTDRPQAVPAR